MSTLPPEGSQNTDPEEPRPGVESDAEATPAGTEPGAAGPADPAAPNATDFGAAGPGGSEPPAYSPPPPGAYQPPPPGAQTPPPEGSPQPGPGQPYSNGYAQPGGYAAPGHPQQGYEQPGYGQPGYGQPHNGYEQPQNGYAPPNGGYAPPGQPGQYQQPYGTNPAQSNVVLNYWLSVFFTWIPALIFYIVDRDKRNPRLTALQISNLNFSLLRVGVGVATWILALIPYLGVLVAVVGWLFSLFLFVCHIIAAAKASEAYRSGDPDPFIFNIPLVK